MIMDPFRPANHDETVARLTAANKKRIDVEDYFCGMFFLTALTAVLWFFIGIGASLFGAETGFSTTFDVLKYIWLSIMGITTAAVAVQTVTALRLRKLKAMPVKVNAAMPATDHLRSLSKNIRAIPPSRRNEFRPLWDAALEANELLRVDPSNAQAKARLATRAKAMEAVVAEERAMREAEARDKASAERQAAISRYSSDDDSDLELASVYVQALRAGRERYESMTQS